MRWQKTELLIQMSQVKDAIFTVFTSSKPWELNPFLRRRLDHRIYIPYPERQERFNFLKKSLDSIAHQLTSEDFEQLAESTEGFNFQDIRNVTSHAARRIYPHYPPVRGVYKPKKMTKFFKLVYPLQTTAINNLIRKYSFMRSYLNIIPFIFTFFNVHFSIFHTESLVKMSNSLWFSRIFTS